MGMLFRKIFCLRDWLNSSVVKMLLYLTINSFRQLFMAVRFNGLGRNR